MLTHGGREMGPLGIKSLKSVYYTHDMSTIFYVNILVDPWTVFNCIKVNMQ